MNLIGLLLTRNSDWCIGLSLRSMLMFCDSVVVMAHNCTDGTLDILMQIGEESMRVVVLEDHDPEWKEMALRQKMMDWARRVVATHVWLQDDDELLTGNLLPTIREHVERTPAGTILQLPWLQLRDGISNVMTTGMWGQQNVCCAFKDEPYWYWQAQGKEQYDFHHRHPMGRPFVPYSCPQLQTPFLLSSPMRRDAGMMHLQFSSRRRLLAKQALYQAVEVIRWPGRKMTADYPRTVRESEQAKTCAVPDSWWGPYRDLMDHLHVDAEPWQEVELRRLVAEHGIERFKGCNFFGVV